MNNRAVDGKVFVLTGASSGIGLEMVKILAQTSAQLILGVRDEKKMNRELAKIPNIHAKIIVLPLDLEEEATIEGFVKKVESAEVLIHCAGVGWFERAENLDTLASRKMFQVNTLGAIELTKQLLAKIKPQGEILFIASIAGLLGTEKSSSYAASKAAIIHFAKVLRLEVLSQKIRVRVVNTGPVLTHFHKENEKYLEKVRKFALSPEIVAKKSLQLIGTRKETLNLPRYYTILVKIEALFPKIFQRITIKFADWK